MLNIKKRTSVRFFLAWIPCIGNVGDAREAQRFMHRRLVLEQLLLAAMEAEALATA